MEKSEGISNVVNFLSLNGSDSGVLHLVLRGFYTLATVWYYKQIVKIESIEAYFI
jgi:hypothetical protein